MQVLKKSMILGDTSTDHREREGTWAYWAPEIFKKRPQNQAVDMWAFGCLVYIVLMGYHPFDPYGDSSDAEMISAITKGTYDGKP